MNLIRSAGLRKFALFFAVIISFVLLQKPFLRGDSLQPHYDGAIIYYAVIDNIQKALALDFNDWTNRKIFYPHSNTLPYTEHFYVHSLIGAPFYALTRDPLKTMNFILFAQFIIAASGYYFVARQLRAGIVATILSSLYFLLLPSIASTHPHISFYSFIPWFVLFCLKLVETRQPRYVYLCGLAYVLQSAVGIYMQVFLLVITPIFILLGLFYLARMGRLRSFFGKDLLVAYLITLFATGTVMLLLNLPYMEFREISNVERSFNAVSQSGATLASFLVGRPRSLGYSGITALVVSTVLLLLALARKVQIDRLAILGFSLTMTFVVLVFSLGPVLNDAASWGIIKLPYYFFYKIHFLFRSIRVTWRFFVLVSLPISILLLFLMEKIKAGRMPAILKIVLLIGFAALIIMDTYRPVRLGSYSSVYDLTYIYKTVERTPGEVLLELPSVFSDNNLMGTGLGIRQDDAYYLFMHIYHKKWTVNGSSGFNPSTTKQLIRQIDNVCGDPDKVRKLFSENPISLVLVHRYRIRPGFENKYEVFIGNLLRIGTLVHIDKNFVLVSTQQGNQARHPDDLKSFERQWHSTATAN